MNNKNILRAYALLQSMTPDELAMLNLLRGLSESEREQLVETLQPQTKSSKKSTTKTRTYEHCTQCDKTKGHSFHKDSGADGYHEFQSSKPKSARASSLAGAVRSNLQQREPTVGGFADDADMLGDLCGKCGKPVDVNAHHKTTDPDYHEFEAQEQAVGASGD